MPNADLRRRRAASSRTPASSRFKQTPSASTPEHEGPGHRHHPARQLRPRRSPTRSPSSSARDRTAKPVPDVKSQTVESAQQILDAQSGFTKRRARRTSTAPSPPARSSAPIRRRDRRCRSTPSIQIQVSKGNQFMMPDLRGQFWTDAEPRLRALGWTGDLDKGPTSQNSGQRSNARGDSEPRAGHADELRRDRSR